MNYALLSDWGNSMSVQDVDFNELAGQISAMPKKALPGSISRISGVIEGLRDMPFPPGYLDALRDDMFRALTGKSCGDVTDHIRTHVYLAFFGNEGRATYMKIGIAKNVRNRMSGIATGNPLPNLWTYSAPFFTRVKATAVEAALLRHMSPDKVHGEWIHVQGLSARTAAEVVASLSEVAGTVHGDEVLFELRDI